MAAEGGQVSKTIVEVYVETDSESEPYSSSEGDDGSETTLTAQEGGTEEEGEEKSSEPVEQQEPQPIPPDMIPGQMSPPTIISSEGNLS